MVRGDVSMSGIERLPQVRRISFRILREVLCRRGSPGRWTCGVWRRRDTCRDVLASPRDRARWPPSCFRTGVHQPTTRHAECQFCSEDPETDRTRAVQHPPPPTEGRRAGSRRLAARRGGGGAGAVERIGADGSIADRKSTRLNSSHSQISYAVFCLKKKK